MSDALRGIPYSPTAMAAHVHTVCAGKRKSMRERDRENHTDTSKQTSLHMLHFTAEWFKIITPGLV